MVKPSSWSVMSAYTHERLSPLRYRAVFIGLALAVVAATGGQYLANTLRAIHIAYVHLPICLLIPFLLFIHGPNIALRARAPYYALTTPELLLIFSMGLMASTLPDWAMNWYLMSVIAGPKYFASPENQWENTFFAYLPDWLVVDRITATGFFEGLPAGAAIPWGGWVAPLFWWLTLIMVLMFVGACIVVMLRKQWVEYEKLQFPLGEISLHLIGAGADDEADRSSVWPAVFRRRLFHIGFMIALAVTGYNCLTYWTNWPHIPIMARDTFMISFGREFPQLPIRMNVFTLCFSFFINVEILFSLWVFQLIGIVQEGLLNRIGMNTSGLARGGLVFIQFIGGMIAFVLWGLWMARRHIREVVRQAFGRPTTLDDRDEMFSYRIAVFGLLAGVIYIIYWLHSAGFSIPVALLFLCILFIFYLALARILAEAGLVMLDLPINAHEFTVAMTGTANLSGPTLTGLGLTNAFARNWRTFTMVATEHAAWFRDRMIGKHASGEGGRSALSRSSIIRYFAVWLFAAFFIGALSSLLYTIHAGYTLGEFALRGGVIGGNANGFYSMIIAWMNNDTQITAREVFALGTGGIMAIGLIVARYVVYWWPLHPIGFVVAASEPIRFAFLPVILAWLVQSLLLRFGGVMLYRKAKPFFLGLLVGYIMGAALSFFVDLVWFPGRPHLFESIFI